MTKKKGFFAEFKEFIARGNVLDMAVGIIIGGAFTAIITALVNGVLTPLLQVIGVNESGFGALQVVLKEATVDTAGAVIADAIVLDFGIVISAIITFLLTALVLFIIVRAVNHIHQRAEELKAKQEAAAEPAPAPAPEPPAPPAPTTEELLSEIRDLLKTKNE